MNNNYLKISAKMKKGIIKAPDGKVRVWYEIKEYGDKNAKVESDHDEVTVAYTVAMRDGNSVQRVPQITLTVGDCVQGIAEGLKLIGTGGKIRLTIHLDWAYGNFSFFRMPANTTLIYDVELLEVVHHEIEGAYKR